MYNTCFNKNNGITLIALVITIIILLIIASVSIGGSKISGKASKDNVLLSELNMVQHAALERETKVLMTGESYPGVPYDSVTEAQTAVGSEITLQDNSINSKTGKSNYYLLNSTELGKLGITNTEDEYIINYKLGEVINKTQLKTSEGELLYLRAKDPQ